MNTASVTDNVPTTSYYRDDHFRRLCINPAEYDRVIDWICTNHPSLQSKNMVEREEWVCHVVNNCIRQIVYGEASVGNYFSTGMCIAIRTKGEMRNSGCDTYVVLAIHL